MSVPLPDAVTAAVVVTGDEVLLGRVRDENGPYIARDLEDAGCRVERIVVVGDDPDRLVAAIRSQVVEGTAVVVVTGGLGPTADDRTMEAVATVAGVPLERDDRALQMVRERMRAIRRTGVAEDEFRRIQEKQAYLPHGATVLPPVGTAPGCRLRIGRTLVVVLPGPPNELQPMWRETRHRGELGELLSVLMRNETRTMRLWWVTEAELMLALSGLPGPVMERIGTYTRHGELEVVVPDGDSDVVETLLRARFPQALFAVDGREVDAIVAECLVVAGATVAVAESCTGGALGARLVARSGASAWFAGGVISYSNDVKVALLGVSPGAIEADGAVSERVAREMAEGARRSAGAEWGVSITGVAGPDGGTPEKPVGTVWIGVAGPDGVDAELFRLPPADRGVVQRRAVTAAMHRLRLRLAGAADRDGGDRSRRP